MEYRFGFDLGSNSIGFAVFELNADKEVEKLIQLGSRIFHDGRNPKDNIPLAVNRRVARGARRRRDRLIQRKKIMVHQLQRDGLFPTSDKEMDALKLLNPYILRADAITRKLEAYELGRVLFHICARRGFKSNRLADGSQDKDAEKELKGQAEKMQALTIAIEQSGATTMGEFLAKRLPTKEGVRFRPDVFNAYPSRSHYEEEFNAIRQKQEGYYPSVHWDELYRIIFTQRPLKPQERGKCRFYIDQERAFASQPSAQRFRIASELNNLQYADDNGNTFTLSDSEKDALFSALDGSDKLTFTKIRKTLSIKGKFNLEDDKRSFLKGNSTSTQMRKDEYFGHQWDRFSIEQQDDIIEKLITSPSNEELAKYLASVLRDEQKIQNLLKKSFSSTTVSLCTKFMRECTTIILEEHIRYDEAVSHLGFSHSVREQQPILSQMPYYGVILQDSVMGAHPEAPEDNQEYKYGKIANPTVHIALNQLRKVVNALIKRYGNPDQIIIETARDISQSAEGRREEMKRQSQLQKENERIKEEIKKMTKGTSYWIEKPTSWDVKKYKLWEELGTDSNARRCPYSGKVIPASKLFTAEIEIEHILPYSRTMLSGMSNLTLSYSYVNRFKKENTPYEAFSSNPDGYDWHEIMERAKKLPNNKGRRFLADAIAPFENKEAGFIERQLNDTRYLSKVAARYLSSICDARSIWSIKGSNTSTLRSVWGLNTILSSSNDPWFKNRADHRHHALDAFVIGLSDRSVLQHIADMNKGEKPWRRKAPICPFSREEIASKIRTTIPTFKVDHGHQGKLFNETSVGKRILKDSLQTIKLADLQKNQIDSILDDVLKAYIQLQIAKGVKLPLAVKSAIQEFGISPDVEIQLGTPVWVTSSAVVDLSKEDIENNRILNRKIAEALSTYTEGYREKAPDLKQRLQQWSAQSGIRKVRIVPKNQVYEKIESVPNKWYQKGEICYTNIWRIPKKKGGYEYQGEFVDFRTALAIDKGVAEPQRPHPAAKKMMTLYKDDVVHISNDERSYYSRIASVSTTRNQIDLQPVFSAETVETLLTNTNPEILPDYKIWEEESAPKQNYKSINVIFSQNRVRKCIFTPDGIDLYTWKELP